MKKNHINTIKKGLVVTLAVVMAVTMSACTTFDNFKSAFIDPPVQEEDVIVVGIYEPITGQCKAQGQEEVKGIELAHELKPEVIGKEVKLIYADNKSSIYEAETALDDLFMHDPDVLLGSYGETLTLFAGDYLKLHDTPGITITSTNPLITTNNSYYFTATYAESRQGIALADFASKSIGKKSYAIIKQDGDDVAAEILRRFTQRIKKDTDTEDCIKCTYSIANTSHDFSEIIKSLKESKVECVFLPLDPNLAKLFFIQATEMNYTSPMFLGIDRWNDDELQQYFSTATVFDIAYPAARAATTEGEEYEKFHHAFRQKYGENAEPTLACMTAYDSYMIAMKAIEDAYCDVMLWDIEEVVKDMETAAAKATRQAYDEMMETKEPDGIRIRAAINNIADYEGASGKITYKGSNECVKPITITRTLKGIELGSYVW